jgi:hypothetical protein
MRQPQQVTVDKRGSQLILENLFIERNITATEKRMELFAEGFVVGEEWA